MLKVLLVEDTSDRASALKAALSTMEGIELACTRDSPLELLDHVADHKPDIVVTDCQMPRLSGLGLAERIRNTPETSDLPVIMLSAKGFELPPGELRSQYGDVFVAKMGVVDLFMMMILLSLRFYSTIGMPHHLSFGKLLSAGSLPLIGAKFR